MGAIQKKLTFIFLMLSVPTFFVPVLSMDHTISLPKLPGVSSVAETSIIHHNSNLPPAFTKPVGIAFMVTGGVMVLMGGSLGVLTYKLGRYSYSQFLKLTDNVSSENLDKPSTVASGIKFGLSALGTLYLAKQSLAIFLGGIAIFGAGIGIKA